MLLKHDIYIPEKGAARDIEFKRGMERETDCHVGLYPLPTERLECYVDDNGMHTRDDNMLAYDFFFLLLKKGGKFLEHAANGDVSSKAAVSIANWHPRGPVWIKVKTQALFQSMKTFMEEYIAKGEACDSDSSDDSSYPEDEASSSETSASDSSSSESDARPDSSSSSDAASNESEGEDDPEPEPVVCKVKKAKVERKD